MKRELSEGTAYYYRLNARRAEYKAVKQLLDELSEPYVTKSCYNQEMNDTDSKLLTFDTLQDVCARISLIKGRFPVSLGFTQIKHVNTKLPLNVLLDLEKAWFVFEEQFGSMMEPNTQALIFKWPYHSYFVLHNWAERIDAAKAMIVNTMSNGTKFVIEPWEPFMKAVVNELRGE